jgi:hypothetical protein
MVQILISSGDTDGISDTTPLVVIVDLIDATPLHDCTQIYGLNPSQFRLGCARVHGSDACKLRHMFFFSSTFSILDCFASKAIFTTYLYHNVPLTLMTINM